MPGGRQLVEQASGLAEWRQTRQYWAPAGSAGPNYTHILPTSHVAIPRRKVRFERQRGHAIPARYGGGSGRRRAFQRR